MNQKHYSRAIMTLIPTVILVIMVAFPGFHVNVPPFDSSPSTSHGTCSEARLPLALPLHNLCHVFTVAAFNDMTGLFGGDRRSSFAAFPVFSCTPENICFHRPSWDEIYLCTSYERLCSFIKVGTSSDYTWGSNMLSISYYVGIWFLLGSGRLFSSKHWLDTRCQLFSPQSPLNLSWRQWV